MGFSGNKNAPYQIFISYRRDGGETLAHLIYDRLIKKNFRVFLDVESLRSGKFNEALYEKIDECTDFLIILPPNSLARCVDPDDWVRLEIERAIERKKNIIPVMMRGFTFPKHLPPTIEDLSNYNGIAASMDFFNAVIEKLLGMLHSKPESSLPLKKIFAGIAAVALLFFGVNAFSSDNTTKPPTSAGGTTKSPPKSVIKMSNSELYQSNANITGSNNIIKGSNNVITGSNNKIIGDKNIITGSNNEIRGNGNSVTGSNNVSYGRDNKSKGSNNTDYTNYS